MNTQQNLTRETTPAAPGSFIERARATWQKIANVVASPHASITEVGARQRAQLQAAFSLILVIMFLIGAVASLVERGTMSANEYVLLFLTALSVAAYFISRTRFFGISGHLLTGGLVVAAFAFLFTGEGSARTLDSFIPLSMVLGSLLLSPVGLGFWASLAVAVIFFIPPKFGIDTSVVIGNYITLGALLTTSVIFRNTIERSRLGELRTINASLRELQVGLEQHVADRTKALATSAEVSRRLTAVTNPRQLTVEVVEQVRSAFNYYHAHIYFRDEMTEDLVMAGGTGEAGAAMLARGHRIQKGRGLVGRAAETNAPVLVPDVSQAAGWLPNPLLPDTKAEIAVPISTGKEVLGVLDVQHNQVNGLGEDDVTLLQSISSQVAISLQNARSYEQSREQSDFEALVNTIGQQIQRSTTVEEALQTAVRGLGMALNAQRVKASIERPAHEN